MQFKVPQDVQREDTIIGPITMRQLIILAIGGGATYAIYVSLATTYYTEIWLPPVVLVGATTLAFAFLKINDQPFYRFLMNFLEYHILAKKRIWIQGSDSPYNPYPPQKEKKIIKVDTEADKKPKQTIEELSKLLDSHGQIELEHKEKQEALKKIINHTA